MTTLLVAREWTYQRSRIIILEFHDPKLVSSLLKMFSDPKRLVNKQIFDTGVFICLFTCFGKLVCTREVLLCKLPPRVSYCDINSAAELAGVVLVPIGLASPWRFLCIHYPLKRTISLL